MAYDAAMNSPSPGPGWWMASDGKWYPQQWEYQNVNAYDQPTPQEAWRAIKPFNDKYGREGWEMVNASTYAMQTTGGTARQTGDRWGVSIVFKRPIAP